MGINIYAEWKGQTRQEWMAQITPFSPVHGYVGYLREPYHGEPYATKFLCREAFASPTASADIPARTLQERLPQTLALVVERERRIYGGDEDDAAPILQSYRDFVALCARKEKETGVPVTIVAHY